MRKATILLSAMMALALLIPLHAYAWGNAHPDTCQPCHGAYFESQESIGGNTYYFWDHDIMEGTPVWDNCIECHSDYTQGTAHDDLNCRGCHAVVHIGYYDGTNYAAGLYYWELSNPSNTIIIAPGTASLVDKMLKLDSTNASNYIPNIANYVGTNGMEVEVGLWDAFNNQFVETSGNYTEPGPDVYKICFSCHFIVQDPASVGTYMLVDGKWKIGIPAAALEMDPHYIYPITPEQTTNTGSESPSVLVMMGSGIIGAALILAARSRIA
ncbi:MAG: hypothetical protein F7C81_01255 [Desulfurococcales archaeon]|nr:hypothetical protein [Desulfurococcales archaeon]